jgi:LysR family transcriptional regulator, glycine cleavage system transcriptional activator
VPVGSPSYLKTLMRGGAIDWTSALLLRVTSTEHDWETWFAGAELELPETGVGLYFDTIHLAVDAAACGLGIAMGREPLIAADLASGRVVRASEVTVEIETGYWLAQPVGDDPRREIKAFRNWVLAEAKKDRGASP